LKILPALLDVLLHARSIVLASPREFHRALGVLTAFHFAIDLTLRCADFGRVIPPTIFTSVTAPILGPPFQLTSLNPPNIERDSPLRLASLNPSFITAQGGVNVRSVHFDPFTPSLSHDSLSAVASQGNIVPFDARIAVSLDHGAIHAAIDDAVSIDFVTRGCPCNTHEPARIFRRCRVAFNVCHVEVAIPNEGPIRRGSNPSRGESYANRKAERRIGR
jgi:hypothetical protein